MSKVGVSKWVGGGGDGPVQEKSEYADSEWNWERLACADKDGLVRVDLDFAGAGRSREVEGGFRAIREHLPQQSCRFARDSVDGDSGDQIIGSIFLQESSGHYCAICLGRVGN